MKSKRLRIGLIGCGKVGLSFISLLKGYSIIGFYDRNLRKIRRAGKFIKRKQMKPEIMVKKADIILIATHDDQIELISKDLRKAGYRNTLIHFSGALVSSILGKKNRASIHPLGSFTDLKIALSRMKKVPFIIEGDNQGIKIAKRLIKSFKGKHYVISAKEKPYYHLACVLSSNLIVALISMAERIVKKRGMKIDLYPLIESTLENLRMVSAKKAITGPVVRGDFNTIHKHLKILRKLEPDYQIIYKILSLKIGKIYLKGDKDYNYSKLLDVLKNRKH